MTSFCDFGNIISLVSTNYTLELRKCFPLCYTKTKNITIGVVTFMQKEIPQAQAAAGRHFQLFADQKPRFVQGRLHLVFRQKKFDANCPRADRDYTLHFRAATAA